LAPQKTFDNTVLSILREIFLKITFLLGENMLKNYKSLTFLSGIVILLSTYSVHAMDEKGQKNNNENNNNQNIPIKQKDDPAAGPSLKVPAASSTLTTPTGNAALDQSLSTTSVSPSQPLNPPGTNKDAATSSSAASISLSPEALQRINSIVDEDYSHHPPEYRHTPEYYKETAGYRQEVTELFVKFGDDHTLVPNKLIRKLVDGRMLTGSDFAILNYLKLRELDKKGDIEGFNSFLGFLQKLHGAR
jgi:hypothetical protein